MDPWQQPSQYPGDSRTIILGLMDVHEKLDRLLEGVEAIRARLEDDEGEESVGV
jgi:hypothetical protein